MRKTRCFGAGAALAGLFMLADALAGTSRARAEVGTPAAAAVSAPRFVVKADKGFIDDPFALNPTAGELAAIFTDSASFIRVGVIDLATGKPKRTIPVGDPQRIFEKVLLSDAGTVVLILRDAGSGKRSAHYYDRDGKALGLVGPATDFGLTTRAGQRLLVAWDRSSTAVRHTVYTLTRHTLDRPVRVGKTVTHASGADGVFKRAPFKVQGWLDGYAQLIGLRPGGYDKATDMRVPDRAAVMDALDGTFAWEADIGDVYAWAAAGVLRSKRPLRGLFLVLPPQGEGETVSLLDARGRSATLTLPVPLAHYDPRSLEEHEDDSAQVLHFSLAIDPLNPAALERRRKDPMFLDLFAARVEGEAAQAGALRATVTQLLRAPLDDRPVGWVVAGRNAAVLRKFQAFSRGGSTIELHDLP